MNWTNLRLNSHPRRLIQRAIGSYMWLVLLLNPIEIYLMQMGQIHHFLLYQVPIHLVLQRTNLVHYLKTRRIKEYMHLRHVTRWIGVYTPPSACWKF